MLHSLSASALLLTVLLTLSGCARTPAGPAAPPPQSLVLNREALDLIGQLDIDSVVEPGGIEQEPLRALVGLGIPALPTMQHYIERSGGSLLRPLLLDAVARIDDAASFSLLSQLAQSQDRGMREDVIQALHHRGAQALPLLRTMLAESSASDVATRLLILEALYRAGDERALGEVMTIGLGHA